VISLSGGKNRRKRIKKKEKMLWGGCAGRTSLRKKQPKWKNHPYYLSKKKGNVLHDSHLPGEEKGGEGDQKTEKKKRLNSKGGETGGVGFYQSVGALKKKILLRKKYPKDRLNIKGGDIRKKKIL